LHEFPGPVDLKWGKIGKWWCDVDPPPTNSFLLLKIFTSVPILGKSIKMCDRKSAYRRTDRHTQQMQTGFIICPMLYAVQCSYRADKYNKHIK